MTDFQITGWGFITLVLLLTGLAFAAGILLPPRMRRRGLARYLVQALALVLTSVLLLASVAALMNRSNHWFTDWDELFSGPPTAADAQTQTYGRELPRGVEPAVSTQTATDLQKDPRANPVFGTQLAQDPGKDQGTSQGRYLRFDLPGKASGQTYGVMVWLPASYLEHPDRFYPVILGFTGFPGSTDTYQKAVDYGAKIEQAASQNQMREAIFVVPEVFPGGYDSECVDATQQPKGQTPPRAETYVTQDLVPWLKENLRVDPDPAGWSTEGYSAGGWCASMLTMRHPDLFQSAMSQSGYFEPQYTRGQEWTAPDDPPYQLTKIASDDPPEVALHLYTSSDDEISWPTTQKMLDAARAPLSVTSEVLPSGGHRLDVWIPGMTEGLKWLGDTNAHFAPTGKVQA